MPTREDHIDLAAGEEVLDWWNSLPVGSKARIRSFTRGFAGWLGQVYVLVILGELNGKRDSDDAGSGDSN